MYLVQVLLPLGDAAAQRFPQDLFRTVGDELTARFGGMTAYTRAPAEGLWQDPASRVQCDEIVVYEVMVATLDQAWWTAYRLELERRFHQQHVVVRAHPITRL